jgi:hypothetical protein
MAVYYGQVIDIPASYSGDSVFKPQLRDRLSPLRFLRVSPSSSKHMMDSTEISAITSFRPSFHMFYTHVVVKASLNSPVMDQHYLLTHLVQ